MELYAPHPVRYEPYVDEDGSVYLKFDDPHKPKRVKRPSFADLERMEANKRKRAVGSKDLPAQEAAQDPHVLKADRLLKENFDVDRWDYLLIGDGSGSRRGYPIGWSCTLLIRRTSRRVVVSGGMNDGTVNVAETMALLHGLWMLLDAETEIAGRRACYISDSEYVVNIGKGTWPCKKHAAMWQAINSCRGRGLLLDYFWCRRDRIGANKHSDQLSKACRKAIKAFHDDMAKEAIDDDNLFSISGDD